MRLLFTFFLISTTFSLLPAQTDLTSKQWQEDLRFLQQKIHSDYQPLFHKITKEDFDKAVDVLYAKIPEMEDHEVVVGFAEIVALFGYGHTALWLTSWRYNQLTDFHQLPYNLYWFEEGVFVQGVHKDYERALGARVLKIGKLPVKEALAAVKPAFSAENDQFFKAHGLHYLGVPEVLHAKGVVEDLNAVTLHLEKDGEEYDMSFSPRKSETFPGHFGLIQSGGEWLDARTSEGTPLWLKHLDRKFYFEYLESDKTVYVRQSEVQDEPDKTIADFYGEVFQFVEENEVDRLIIDLRLNSGGNNYKNKPVVTGLIKCEKINQPGKLFVVLGRRTFSACQNLVNEMENYTEATFIGEATAENVNFFGDNRTETLPNSKLPVRLSYLWWQDKDPRDTRPWTPPHVAVDLSFADYKTNHDPVLQTILTATDPLALKDPWLQMVELFHAGKMEELKAKAVASVNDPKYRYFDFEDRINQAGYDLMSDDRIAEAISVFNLNAELFPESANCWDSLAESFWKSGDIAKAKEYYNKAISMDPHGATGENAMEMLKRIGAEK